MSIEKSGIESKQYGRHYGATKEQALYLGEGLSPGTSLKGNIRGVVDRVLIPQFPQHDLDVGEVAFGWKFEEPVTILEGTIKVANPIPGSGNVLTSLYTDDTSEASIISSIFDVLETDALTFHINLHEPSVFPDVPKGCVVGFKADVLPILANVEIKYSLLFLTTL